MNGMLSDPRFLALFKQMYGKMEESEATKRKRLQEMLGLTTQRLGSTLASKMGRVGVPVAGGWENVANRFMGPLGTQMEAGLETMPFEEMVNQSMGLSQMMFPLYNTFTKSGFDWASMFREPGRKFTGSLFG